MKGGVGKTTLTKELGYYMASEKNKKVLFIDLDPQSNLTQSFFLKYGLRHTEDLNDPSRGSTVVKQSIQSLFEASSIKKTPIEDIILNLEDDNDIILDLIPGTLSTIFLERAGNTSNMEKSIYNFIEEKELRNSYDYILIDCPPTFSVYTTAALLPSDYYLVPVDPSIYSVLGIKMLEKVVNAIKEPNRVFFKDKPIRNLGVVFTRYKDESSELIEMIKGASAMREMYFFSEKFLHTKKLIDKPFYFISDFDDTRLRNNINDLFEEMEGRINGLQS
ncbi:ParA family protein [Marinilactibacillus psychrotolerans]|uniref:ParA family protein n=2 Tax=Marinilactibacillus psychrotolerans TaxID=191770 RepID=A0A5R9C079_9LACT|nr:ParA family protein [Marinilactibacillus psychrotolerans]